MKALLTERERCLKGKDVRRQPQIFTPLRIHLFNHLDFT
jgi:hypothetical protein